MSVTNPLSLAEVHRLASGADTVLLRAGRDADLETPIGAFLRMDDGGPAYLLESVEGGERLGRFSFFAVGPRRILTVTDGASRIQARPVEEARWDASLPVETLREGDPLEALRAFVPRRRVEPVVGMPRFIGGAVGSLAYDAVSVFEPTVPLPDADPVGVPLATFLETDLVLVFDHLTHTISAIASLHMEAPRLEERYRIAERAIWEALERTGRPSAAELAFRLPAEGGGVEGDAVGTDATAEAAGPAVRPAGDAADPDDGVRTSLGRDAYERAVVAAKDAIAAGEAIQVVLARRQTIDLPAGADGGPIDGLALYRALRRVNPSPYLFFVRAPGHDVVGASPELLLQVERRRMATHPIAGTRPRGATEDEDRRLAEELQADPKERAEHVMLVDLGRNDLGRVAEPGTVAVTRYMEVERYSHVLHLVSHVEAKLAKGRDAIDALRSVFPAGTLSGAPKVRAMQLIARAEGERRGLYGGAVGYLGYDGDLDTAITIRSAVLKDGVAHIHAGAGIVKGSDPASEYRETEHKAAAMRRAIDLAAGIPPDADPAVEVRGAVVAAAGTDRGQAMILVIDNYDSFTFNLVQALQAAGAEVLVVRNDAIDRDGIEALADDPAADLRGIVVSPGPGDPDGAGVSVDAIRLAAERRIPLLGVCLGMQAMGAAFGARIVRAPTLVHGEASAVAHDGRGLLAGLPQGFQAARYHSLVVDESTLPDEVETTSTAEDGAVLMGIRHRFLPIEGVQFHPESVLTPQGPHLLANFLRLAGEGDAGILDAATGSFATRGLGGTESASDDEGVRVGEGEGVREGVGEGEGQAPQPPVPKPGAGAVHHALLTVVEGGSLTFDESLAAMGAVMDGEATPAQLAALLVALRMRGETTDELAGFAAAMRARVIRVDAPTGTIDTVGTGGDRSGTFNISTASALVVAAAGVPVAKHGNRAVTSRSGSADVLAALGVRIDHDAASAAAGLRELGFAFLFAPGFHPAMRHAGPTRREIGVRTAFNLLGPLTNPAGVRRLVVGSADPAAAPRLAAVLARLGDERAFVVHGDGVDELPLDGTGVLYDVTPAGTTRREVVAASFGLSPAPTSALAGGTPEENAALVERVLAGEPGPRLDVVLLNAGATFAVAGRTASISEGIDLARATVRSGAATALLERLRTAKRLHDAELAPIALTTPTDVEGAVR